MPWVASRSVETSGWYIHSFIPYTICKLQGGRYSVYTEETQGADTPTKVLPSLEEAFFWAENHYTKRNKSYDH